MKGKAVVASADLEATRPEGDADVDCKLKRKKKKRKHDVRRIPRKL